MHKQQPIRKLQAPKTPKRYKYKTKTSTCRVNDTHWPAVLKGTDQWKHSQMNSLSAALIGSSFKRVSHKPSLQRMQNPSRVQTQSENSCRAVKRVSLIFQTNTQTHEGEITAIHTTENRDHH